MRTRSLILASIVAALFLVACEGAESPQLTPPGGDPATPPAGNGDAAGQQVTVTLQNNMFEPRAVTIPRGGEVTWANEDQANHTATHGTGGEPHGDPLFDMPLSPGTEATYTFAEAGSFPVTCTIHPQMQMDVTVTP
jgi:plastocyanin